MNLIIIIFGVIFRLREYFFNRSLWIDESSISLEIINKSFTDLFKPLGFEQSAPIGFLLLEKLAVKVFGFGEQALRFFPMVLGLFSIWLFYLVCKKILKGKSVLIALFAFSFSEHLIYYSNEVKPYIFDVFIDSVLYLVFIQIINVGAGFIPARDINYKRVTTRVTPTTVGDILNLKYLTILAGTGAISVFFSQPAIFVLAGIAFALLMRFRSKILIIKQLIAVFLIWGSSFVINFLFFQLPTLKDYGLKSYWSGYFAPFPSLRSSDWIWYWDAFINFFNIPFSSTKSGALILVLFIIGCTYLVKKKLFISLGILLPLIFVLIASALKLYPFTDRLLLFLTPSVIIVVSYALGKIIDNKNQYLALVGFGIIIYLFIPKFFNAQHSLFIPKTVEEVRPLVKYYQNNRQKNDKLYVYYGANLQYQYYAQLFNIKESNLIIGIERTDDTNEYLEDIKKLDGNNRVWVLFSHDIPVNGISEKQIYLNELNKIGKLIDYQTSNGASIYFYDLSTFN